MEQVTKFIGASWTVRISMIAAAIVYLDPVGYLTANPQFIEWLPDGIEMLFMKAMFYLTVLANVYQRSKTKLPVTWNPTAASPKETVKAAEAPALTPQTAEVLRKQLEAFDAQKI